MAIFSVEQLEGMHHSLQFDGVPVPTPEDLRQDQTANKVTGVLESWFDRHNAGFISSAVGRFEFTSSDIISGDPRPWAAVTFEVRWPGDRRNSVGTAGNVEIEPKVEPAP